MSRRDRLIVLSDVKGLRWNKRDKNENQTVPDFDTVWSVNIRAARFIPLVRERYRPGKSTVAVFVP
jgi:hypothetical protein